MISTELLCIHLAGERIAVDDIQHVHSAVADVGDHVNAGQFRCKRRDSCVPLGIDANITDADGVVYLAIGEMNVAVTQL